MKIVVFDNLPDGGAKRVVYEQVKGLSKNNIISYVTHDKESVYPIQKYADGYYPQKLDWRDYRGYKRPLKEWDLVYRIRNKYREIASLIDQMNPDVVLVHPCMLTQAPILLEFLNSKSVYFMEEWLRLVYEPDLHPTNTFNFPNKLYESARRQILKRLDYSATKSAKYWITHSDYMASCIKSTYGVTPSKVPLGVAIDSFKPDPSIKPKHFLFVGEKEEINGYPLLESVLRNNKFPIKYLTFSEQGYVSSKQMVHLYQSSIAVLCLSKNEPFGLVPLEAMACGVPVIAVDEGGHKDTIINGETGILIPRKPDVLIEAMNRLMNDKQLRDNMGRAGRGRVKKYYTWDKHNNKLESVLKKLGNISVKS